MLRSTRSWLGKPLSDAHQASQSFILFVKISLSKSITLRNIDFDDNPWSHLARQKTFFTSMVVFCFRLDGSTNKKLFINMCWDSLSRNIFKNLISDKWNYYLSRIFPGLCWLSSLWESCDFMDFWFLWQPHVNRRETFLAFKMSLCPAF